EESWMEIGSKYVVFYSDDDVWHERYVLLPGDEEGFFWIWTPDDDVYEEDMRGKSDDGPAKVRFVPVGVKTLPNLRKAVYRFRDDVTDQTLLTKVREAHREHKAAYGVAGLDLEQSVRLPSGDAKTLGEVLSRKRLTGKGPIQRAAPKGPFGPAGPKQCWRCAETRGSFQLGDRISPDESVDLILGASDAAFHREGLWLRGELVDDAVFSEWLAARRREVGLTEPGSHSGGNAATGEGVPAETGGDPGGLAEERDLRILPILFDSAEERWRSLAEAVPEYEEVDFDDFPLQGPRTVYRDVRQLRRSGMDFIQHHESWIKKSGVRATDRSVHEHLSICRVLHLMASYDQLNLPSLASAEGLNRRRALIEMAHQGRPEAPSYEGADEILGVREATDGTIVDPALTQHAARRQAAKAEILKQNRLAAEEKRHAGRRNEEPDKNKQPDKGGKAGGKGDKNQSTP
ncbi:unnamed protein product, partial [Symbiodinium necroappetens]